jgi:hypothetical protein
MYGWGVQVREMIGLYTESKCWRCLSETVPQEDELSRWRSVHRGPSGLAAKLPPPKLTQDDSPGVR